MVVFFFFSGGGSFFTLASVLILNRLDHVIPLLRSFKPIAFSITYNSRSFSPITLGGGIPFDLEGVAFAKPSQAPAPSPSAPTALVVSLLFS